MGLLGTDLGYLLSNLGLSWCEWTNDQCERTSGWARKRMDKRVALSQLKAILHDLVLARGNRQKLGHQITHFPTMRYQVSVQMR